MKLALMQPYLFPYLGYFALVAAVDRFVFYDDVNFIKNGWINRNRTLHQDASHAEPRWWTVPLEGASPFDPIDAVRTQPRAAWRRKLLETLRHQYAKAPRYAPTMALVEDVLALDSDRIADLARASVVKVARAIGLETAFVTSSRGYGNGALRGTARVLDICRREGATEYWNLPGGRALYAPAEFEAYGVQLHFVDDPALTYPQGPHAFVPHLSVIDALMHVEPAVLHHALHHALQPQHQPTIEVAP